MGIETVSFAGRSFPTPDPVIEVWLMLLINEIDGLDDIPETGSVRPVTTGTSPPRRSLASARGPTSTLSSPTSHDASSSSTSHTASTTASLPPATRSPRRG